MGPINVHDYERLAQERLSPAARAYYSGGAGDKVTLREERAAFERLRLLQGVSGADLRTKVFGTPVGMPTLVAPPDCMPSPTPTANLPPPAAPGRRGR